MQLIVVLVLAFLIVGAFISPIWVQSQARGGERVRAFYSDRSRAFYLRNGLGLLPVLGFGLVLVALAALLPREPAALCLLAFPLVYTGFVAAGHFVIPGPLLPGWLRDEIDAGRMPLERPDHRDWIKLRNNVILFAIGEPALIYLVVIGAFRRFG